MGQAAPVRSGEISPAELVEEAISGIERLNPQLNAVVIPLFERRVPKRTRRRTARFGVLPIC